MDGTSIYEIFRDIAIVHSNSEEWRSVHCFGVGFLADLNTDNLEQSFFRKEYFYSEKWNEAGKDASDVKLDFPMCMFEPVVSSGEIDKEGKQTGNRIFKCTMYIADLYGYDRNNVDDSTYAKRTREAIWRDTEFMGLQMLKEFNRVGWLSQPKFSLANGGKYETDSMFDIANKRLVITSFDFSITIPVACLDGSFISPNPLPPSASIPIGTIIAWDGGKWARINPGQAGYVLQTNGPGELPSWEEVQAGGGEPLFEEWESTVAEVDNWNEAYSWGDHAGLYALVVHNHDDRYYTESEIDTLLSDKADVVDLYAHTSDNNNPHLVSLEQARSQDNFFMGEVDMNGNRLRNLPTPVNADEAVSKSYVDGLVDNTLKAAQAFTPVGSYPTTYNGQAIQKGDSFRLSAGTIGAIVIDGEELLIAQVDTPGQTPSNWQILESNREQSTESVKGIAKIVSQVDIENELSSNNADIVTAQKFWFGILRFIALPWTWAAKQIFTLAPRFSSVTASKVLAVDGNKDLTTKDVDATPTGSSANLVESGGVKSALDLKRNFPVQRSGTAITLETDAFYGTRTTPETGNITISYTGAVVGAEVVVWHQHSSIPTITGGTVVYVGDRGYKINQPNEILIYATASNAVRYGILNQT